MKKFFQKTIIATLTCLMLTFSFGSKPVEADSAKAIEVVSEIGQRATEISENLMDLKILEASNIGGMTKVGCAFRCVTSVIKLGFSILKLSGVFGTQKNPAQIIVEHLDNRFTAIDKELIQIDDNLKQMERSINEQLQDIDSSITRIDNTLSRANITKVAEISSKIMNDIKLFENTISSNVVDWYDVDNNPNYNRKLNVTYLADESTGETKTVYIPKALMDEVLDYADAWDINNQDTLVKKAFKEAITVAITGNVYTKTKNDFDEYCRVCKQNDYASLPEQDQTNVINDFSQAAYDSLRYECMKKIAKARTSSAKTYANDLIELYTNYCNYLCETGEHKSPLKSQYDVYSKTHAFQGELKCTIMYDADGNGTVETTEDTNLAALARDKYFGELNEMGAYVSEIAKASGAYTNDDLYNNIYYPWAKSEAALNEQYNNFYNVDNFGNDIDNYSYVTGTVLSYSLDNVQIRMMMSYVMYHKGSTYKLETRDKKLVADWNSSVGNQYLASSNELSKIYAYFSGERTGGKPKGASKEFYNFLKNCGVFSYYNDFAIDEKSPLIITSFNGGIDLGSGDKVQMLAYAFPNSCDKYCDHNNGNYQKAEGYNTKGAYSKYNYYYEIINGSTPDMVFKRKAIANTFNVLTGETITNNNVGTAAMYFKDYKNEDDMGLLIDAEYVPTKYYFEDPQRNKNDTALNYNVDTAFKWPYEYINYDRSEAKDLYHMEIDYLRQYGAIIENDVNIYKANGKMSRTNTIELVANNVINSNDYVNKISFTNITPVVNGGLINDIDKVNYEATANNINKADKNFQDKFVTLLKNLYPGKDDDIAKLEANKTYSITFDNKNYENLDMETYKEMLSKLINFLKPDDQGNNSNINEMVETYRNLYSEITEIVDVLNVENNKMAVSLSKNDYLKLAENILKDDFGDFVICENKSDVSSCAQDKLVYCKEDKKVYIWDSATTKFVIWDNTVTTNYKIVPNDKMAVNDTDISQYTSAQINDIEDKYATAINKPEKYIKNSDDEKYYQWIDISELKRSGSYVALTGKNIKVVSATPGEKDTEYIYNSETKKYYQWKDTAYVEISNLPDTIDNISVVNEIPTSKTTNFVYNTANNKYYKWMTNGNYSKLTINNVKDVKPASYEGYIVKVGSDYYYWKDDDVDTNVDTNIIENGQYKPINSGDSTSTVMTYCYIVDDLKCYKYKDGAYVAINDERIKEASNENTYNGLIAKISGNYYQWISTENVSPTVNGEYIKIDNVDELPTSRTSNLVVYNSGDCYLWKTVDRYVEVNELFEDDSIVKVAAVPSEFKGLVIQCTTDNKFYYWNDSVPSVSGGYVENSSLVSTTGLEDGNKTYKYPYPYVSISDLKLCYQVKPIISFELYFDKEINNKADVGNANIKYNVVPYYDITPVLLWKDGSQAQQSLEISNETLKDTGIKLMPIKIPVVQMNDANDTTALIYHFNSMDDTSSPIDQYNPAIKTDVNGNKYATIYVNSFSPFTVKKTYVRTETEKKNKFPVTGIE